MTSTATARADDQSDDDDVRADAIRRSHEGRTYARIADAFNAEGRTYRGEAVDWDRAAVEQLIAGGGVKLADDRADTDPDEAAETIDPGNTGAVVPRASAMSTRSGKVGIALAAVAALAVFAMTLCATFAVGGSRSVERAKERAERATERAEVGVRTAESIKDDAKARRSDVREALARTRKSLRTVDTASTDLSLELADLRAAASPRALDRLRARLAREQAREQRLDRQIAQHEQAARRWREQIWWR